MQTEFALPTTLKLGDGTVKTYAEHFGRNADRMAASKAKDAALAELYRVRAILRDAGWRPYSCTFEHFAAWEPGSDTECYLAIRARYRDGHFAGYMLEASGAASTAMMAAIDAADYPPQPAGFIAGVSEVQCERCGEWLPENEDAPTWRVYGGNYILHDACAEETHWHVVAFISGCLNDYDSGPYLSLEDARTSLADVVEGWNANDDFPDNHYIPAGIDRYERGIYILKVEECRESTCFTEGGY